MIPPIKYRLLLEEEIIRKGDLFCECGFDGATDWQEIVSSEYLNISVAWARKELKWSSSVFYFATKCFFFNEPFDFLKES